MEYRGSQYQRGKELMILCLVIMKACGSVENYGCSTVADSCHHAGAIIGTGGVVSHLLRLVLQWRLWW